MRRVPAGMGKELSAEQIRAARDAAVATDGLPSSEQGYRPIGLVALIASAVLFVSPLILTWVVLSISARYAEVRGSGIMEVTAAYEGGSADYSQFDAVYDARYAIIGGAFLVFWGLLALIITISTRPRK